MSLEEAQALQRELLAGCETGEVSQKINAAARLMLTGRHDDCIAAYSAIAAEHPEERGTCEGQIGAAHFFKGDYETAIRWYEAARSHGADASMMEDNIKEAQEALAKKSRGEDPSASQGGINPLTILLLLGALGAAVYFLVL